MGRPGGRGRQVSGSARLARSGLVRGGPAVGPGDGNGNGNGNKSGNGNGDGPGTPCVAAGSAAQGAVELPSVGAAARGARAEFPRGILPQREEKVAAGAAPAPGPWRAAAEAASPLCASQVPP